VKTKGLRLVVVFDGEETRVEAPRGDGEYGLNPLENRRVVITGGKTSLCQQGSGRAV